MGTEQTPFNGVSLVYSFSDAKAPSRHTTQYFEMFGNRAIYSDGWVACTRHSIPWLLVKNPPLKDDVWELYHVDEDFSEGNNLADKDPEKLKELQDLFMKEAEKNHVLPIDDRRSERFNATIAGRPDIMGDRTKLTVYTGMTGMTENAFINVKNRHHTIDAVVDLSNANTNGVILAQAGAFGGWTLYLKGGKPHYEYNYFGVERTNITSATAGPGRQTCNKI
jgi:arylsulfatase